MVEGNIGNKKRRAAAKEAMRKSIFKKQKQCSMQETEKEQIEHLG